MKTFDAYMLILGGIVVLGFFGLLTALLTVKATIANVDLVNIAMGGLITAFITIINYFFGSSHGSKVKTDMIDKMTTTASENGEG